VNAVRSFETLGSSNPATLLHIPDDLSVSITYTTRDSKGKDSPDPSGARCRRGLRPLAY
jgi:hypothetical protein